jgi:hypothetical protein
VFWTEPICATMPRAIEVRLVESVDEQPGQRTQKFTIATTLLDHKQNDASVGGWDLSRLLARGVGYSRPFFPNYCCLGKLGPINLP